MLKVTGELEKSALMKKQLLSGKKQFENVNINDNQYQTRDLVKCAFSFVFLPGNSFKKNYTLLMWLHEKIHYSTYIQICTKTWIGLLYNSSILPQKKRE